MKLSEYRNPSSMAYRLLAVTN